MPRLRPAHDPPELATTVFGLTFANPVGLAAGVDKDARALAGWNALGFGFAELGTITARPQPGNAPPRMWRLPSHDALINRLGFRSDIKRTPIFGLGCVAGAAGTARASDYLRAFPDHACVLLSVELCSLTLQREDLSVANIIASGLFGDGAAAVVFAGAGRRDSARRGPQILATRSVFYPDTERVMGWDLVDGGFKVVLSAKVPQLATQHIRRDVDSFLGDHQLDRGRISHWIAHTGGPKVLDAFQSALELPAQSLERSWRSLSETGNLSSASVLFVLGELLDAGTAKSGDYGLLLAMGPGFCSELVLLRW